MAKNMERDAGCKIQDAGNLKHSIAFRPWCFAWLFGSSLLELTCALSLVPLTM